MADWQKLSFLHRHTQQFCNHFQDKDYVMPHISKQLPTNRQLIWNAFLEGCKSGTTEFWAPVRITGRILSHGLKRLIGKN